MGKRLVGGPKIQVGPKDLRLTSSPSKVPKHYTNRNRTQIHSFISFLSPSSSPSLRNFFFHFSKQNPTQTLSLSLSLPPLLDKSRRFFLLSQLFIPILLPFPHLYWKFLFPSFIIPTCLLPHFFPDSSLLYLSPSLYIYLRSSCFGQDEYLCFFSHMASISQGLVLTTAMLVSSTVVYLGFLRQKTFPLPHFPGDSNSKSQHPNKKALCSCLCSEERKRESKKKKKRVKFADNVKEETETKKKKKDLREKQRKQNRASSSSCRHEIPEVRRMPENRIALYNGILRDRVHSRLGYSC